LPQAAKNNIVAGTRLENATVWLRLMATDDFD
jgi:hypothetical protein